jgi:hypothetical protein
MVLAAKFPISQQHTADIIHHRTVISMWIPTPIYERIPQFWLLLGLLFMSSGTYLGFDYKLSFAYFGVGFVCLAWSLWIFTMRLKSRGQQRQFEVSPRPVLAKESQDEAADRSTEPAA